MYQETTDHLPPLTHLQFLVLDIVGSSQISGKDLRSALAKEGLRKTGPAFYQMMSRLEESKLLEGWYEQQVIEGQILKERWYRILGNGVLAVQATQNFYRKRLVANPVVHGGRL